MSDTHDVIHIQTHLGVSGPRSVKSAARTDARRTFALLKLGGERIAPEVPVAGKAQFVLKKVVQRAAGLGRCACQKGVEEALDHTLAR